MILAASLLIAFLLFLALYLVAGRVASQRIGGANLLADFANSSLYITARMQKLYEEKHAIHFPLWRERVKVANFVCCRQIPMEFGTV